MRSARCWCRVLGSVLVGGVAGVTSAADDSTLTAKGLSKQNSTYVLEAEKPVLAKLKEARGALKDMTGVSSERAKNQQVTAQTEDLEQQRTMLQLQLEGLSQQIALQPPSSPGGGGGMGGSGGGMGGSSSGGSGGPGGSGGFGKGGGGGPGGGGGGPSGGSSGGFGSGMGGQSSGGSGGFGSGGQGSSPLVMQREQIRQQLLMVINEQRLLKSQGTPSKDETAVLDKRVQKAEDTFKATLADLRKQVDEVLKKYAELDADYEVKKSLAEVRKTNTRAKLGPSDAFTAATRELDKAERQYLDKKPASSVANKKKTAARSKR